MRKRYTVLNDKDSKYGDVLIQFRRKPQARITLWADCYFLDDDYVEDFRDYKMRCFDTLEELLDFLTFKWRWQVDSRGRQRLPEVCFDLSNYQRNPTRRESAARDARFLISDPAARADYPQEKP